MLYIIIFIFVILFVFTVFKFERTSIFVYFFRTPFFFLNFIFFPLLATPLGLLARLTVAGFTYFCAFVCIVGSVDCKQLHTVCRPVALVLHRLSCLSPILVEQHCGQRVNVARHCQLVIIRTVHGGGHYGVAALQPGCDVGEHQFYRPTVSAPCARVHYTKILLKKWTYRGTDRWPGRENGQGGANVVR